MLFTSPVFLLLFLPVLLAIYHHGFIGRRLQNALLLLASLLFYAWGEAFYVLVLLASIGLNYLGGLAVHWGRGRLLGPWLLGLFVAANLGLLASYKYANFLVDNLNALTGLAGLPALELAAVHLPIGISFFTFQALSYLIDLWRGSVRVQRNPFDLALYIALFPQLIAGPIVRYSAIEAQLKVRQTTVDDIYLGLRRFVFGLAKKLMIANPLGLVADQIFAIPGNELTAPLAWLGVLTYSLQLYFDFSAYSCMAIGLGRMFGFHFPENFNYPYIARSVQDFWRRWHISLSTWFRDYLYIPLGGNRLGARRTYLNLLLVFFLCGLWHGASWNFVIWGLFHGAFLAVERAGLGALLTRLWAPLAHTYTLLVVMVAWVFFRADTLPQALDFLQAMAGFGQGDGSRHDAGFFLDNEIRLVLLAAVLFSLPLGRRLADWLDRPRAAADVLVQPAAAAGILLTLSVCILYALAGNYNPFIYFRF